MNEHNDMLAKKYDKIYQNLYLASHNKELMWHLLDQSFDYLMTSKFIIQY